MSNDIPILLIGALISLVSSVIGYLLKTLSEAILNKVGEVRIYKKLIYSKQDQAAWGVRKTPEGMSFHIPIWIEIHNTTKVNQIVRDINLKLYKQGKFIGKAKQATHHDINNEKINYGDKGSYSILAKPNSIQRYDLLFFVKYNQEMKDFDEIRVSYYSNNEKEKESSLLRIASNPWDIKNNKKIDNEWDRLF